MTGKYESYFESFRSLTESELLLRVISVKPKFHPKMCHRNEGEGNRRKEVNDGFTFPALIQKIRVMPSNFFTPQAESF